MKKIALADIPEEYYEKQPLMFRGNISTLPIQKPADISQIPPSIWIKKSGSQGKLPQDFENVIIDISDSDQESIAPKSRNDLDEKRTRLINLKSPSFHYLDGNAINRLYEATFKAPVINNEQSIRDLTLKIENRLRQKSALSANSSTLQGDSQRSALITSQHREPTVEEKYAQLQTHLLHKDQVILDLETRRKHSQELTQFDTLIDQVQQHGLRLDPRQVNEKRQQIKIKSIQDAVDNLKDITDRYALISTDFAIKDLQEKYRLVFNHPLTQVANKDIRIMVDINKQDIEEGWWRYYARLIKYTVQANVFGTVSRSSQSEGYWEIAIKPIAIYSDSANRQMLNPPNRFR
ncbi:MAG: hypothetical protein AAF152_15485 [Cyanobacteria bacterium P01_A01_bin.114]